MLKRVMMRMALWIVVGLFAFTASACAQSTDEVSERLQHWETDWSRHTIDLSELKPGGPPKDGIPAIDDPQFVSVEDARAWIAPQEPVIALELRGEARAYPLQILVYHEIVNDRVAGVPVAVTFCPLCYSAIAFRRTVGGEVLSFGVSGLLRHSDLVMYDRKTESLWQQFTGEAIVGDYVGTTLERLPVQIISFAQFTEAYPEGRVPSRETGYDRPYGRNPYAGYDDISNTPLLYDGPTDDRLLPMQKVVAVRISGESKAYPHRLTREEHVIHDEVGGQPVVVFHTGGAVSALAEAVISASREIGSTGVFDPRVGGRMLRFRYEDGQFVDQQTGSVWNITGQSVAGPLEGKQLTPIEHGDYFAFAWFAFRPETQIYQEKR